MTVDTEFAIGDTVYHITDSDQRARLVISILITPEGCRYLICSGTTESYHYALELSATKNILL
jgi:hypothetical protein